MFSLVRIHTPKGNKRSHSKSKAKKNPPRTTTMNPLNQPLWDMVKAEDEETCRWEIGKGSNEERMWLQRSHQQVGPSTRRGDAFVSPAPSISSQFFPSAQCFPALILLWRVKKAKDRRHRLSLGWCASAWSAEQKDTDLRIQPPGLLSILQVQNRATEEQLRQAATAAHSSDAGVGAEHVPLEGRVYWEEREAKTGVFPRSFTNTGKATMSCPMRMTGRGQLQSLQLQQH